MWRTMVLGFWVVARDHLRKPRLQVLSAKARFVKMVIEGKIVIRKRHKLIRFESAAWKWWCFVDQKKQGVVFSSTLKQLRCKYDQTVELQLGKLFNARKRQLRLFGNRFWHLWNFSCNPTINKLVLEDGFPMVSYGNDALWSLLIHLSAPGRLSTWHRSNEGMEWSIDLVGGLEHEFYCSIQLGIIIPTDFHIFQRGRSTTNQTVINVKFTDYSSMDRSMGDEG